MKKGMRLRGGFMNPGMVGKAAKFYGKNKAQIHGLAGAAFRRMRPKGLSKIEGVLIPKIRPRNPSNDDATTGNLTHSNVTWGAKALRSRARMQKWKAIQDVTPRLCLARSQNSILTCGVNQQGYISLTFGNSADYNTAFTAADAALGGITLTNVDRMYVESIVGQLKIQSASNISQELDIYEVFPRHDQTLYSPATAFTTGINDASFATYSVNANDLNMTPFKSQLFTNYYYVRRVKRLNLPPGSGHIHHFHYILHKQGFRERLVSTTASTTIGVQGFSGSFLLINQGTVIHDSVNYSYLGSGSTNLDVWMEYTLNYRRAPYQNDIMMRSETATSVTTAAQVLVNTVVNTIVANE